MSPNRAERREKSYYTLQDWGHARLVTLDLPDGKSVDIDLPDIAAYRAYGTIPNPLRGIAYIVERSTDLASLSEEESSDFLKLQVWVIATHLRKPDLLKEFGETQLECPKSEEWVAKNVPPMHRNFIWNTAMTHGIASDVVEALMKVTRDRVGNAGAARFPGRGQRTPDTGDGAVGLKIAE